MQFNSNYTFEVSLSKEAFSDKVISGAMIGTTKNEENRRIRKQYGFASNKGIGFERTEVNAEQLLNSLLDGKVFCHLFNPASKRKDNTFGSSQKKNDNFTGSYVIGVDIDHTSYKSAEEYVSKLTLQPTFYYTSYSNMQTNEDGTSKGARFRLIYVFDKKIKNPYFFRFCAYQLNRIIEKDTDEFITDDCNLRCSQYFNGTNRNNADVILSYGITNTIYSLEDIEATETNFIDFLCGYANYKTISNSRTEEINYILNNISSNHYTFNKSSKSFQVVSSIDCETTTINDEMENKDTENNNIDVLVNSDSSTFSRTTETILNDWSRLDEEEFKKCSEWENARRTTKYVYRVEKEWINNLYQNVDEDYFSMFYYTSTLKDGQKRRKSLYQRMCLRRVINPAITKDEMVVNTIIDIMRFFDNSDGVLDSDYIRRNVESAFNVDVEDIEETYKESINYLKASTKPKRGIIYNGKQAHSKETTFSILDEYYDISVSVTENLDTLNNVLNYQIGKSTVYEYLKNRNIKTNNNKLSDEEIIGLLDVNLSVRKNLEFLKDNDIKIGKDRVNKLLNIKKNNNQYNSVQEEQLFISTTINDKMENKDSEIFELNHASNSDFINEEIIEQINSIDVVDFCKCYNGIEEVIKKVHKNIFIINVDKINNVFYGLMNKVESISPYLADIGRTKMNQLIA